jgi:hypothetical protein
MNMIDKLEKQRKRLAVRVSVPAHPTVDSETTLGAVPPAKAVRHPRLRLDPTEQELLDGLEKLAPKEIDTSIPSFLRRSPDPAAEAIRAEQAEARRLKATGRIAKLKAQKSGETRKMPLTGKAALAAIRGQ